MLIYWLPLAFVLLLRALRIHREEHRQQQFNLAVGGVLWRVRQGLPWWGDDGFVTSRPKLPWQDNVLAVVSGRVAIGVTAFFGVLSVAALLVALSAVPSGATSLCQHLVGP